MRGRTVVVTGAGRGIGRAAAIWFARRGAKVALVARTEAEIDEAAAEAKDAGLEAGAETLSIPADIGDESSVAGLFAVVKGRFGPVETLVNNAAIVGPIGRIWELDPDAWRYSFRTNVHGAFLCCRLAIPQMMQTGRGRVINLISGMASLPWPRFAAYGAAKAALIQFTRVLAAELDDSGITVNAIDPGTIDTRMHEDLRNMGPEALGAEIHRQLMDLKRFSRLHRPESVAELIGFLASDAAAGIHGQIGNAAHFKKMGFRRNPQA